MVGVSFLFPATYSSASSDAVTYIFLPHWRKFCCVYAAPPGWGTFWVCHAICLHSHWPALPYLWAIPPYHSHECHLHPTLHYICSGNSPGRRKALPAHATCLSLLLPCFLTLFCTFHAFPPGNLCLCMQTLYLFVHLPPPHTYGRRVSIILPVYFLHLPPHLCSDATLMPLWWCYSSSGGRRKEFLCCLVLFGVVTVRCRVCLPPFIPRYTHPFTLLPARLPAAIPATTSHLPPTYNIYWRK